MEKYSNSYPLKGEISLIIKDTIKYRKKNTLIIYNNALLGPSLIEEFLLSKTLTKCIWTRCIILATVVAVALQSN